MGFNKILLTVALAAAATGANATTILPGHETPLQTVLNNITNVTASNPTGNSSVNVLTDQMSPDQVWTNTDSGITPALFVIEIAGNSSTNTFGIYDENNTSSYFQLFSGSDTTGADSTFSILDDGSVLLDYASAAANGASSTDMLAQIIAGNTQFDTGIDFSTGNFGFYLGTGSAGTPTFFSIEADNPGGYDQMVAFSGKGDSVTIGGQTKNWTSAGSILAFEDLSIPGSDQDFNDLVIMVESTHPVSEPATIALLGLGLMGLGMARRKQAKS